MKKYYVEYVEKDGRRNRTTSFKDFSKAFDTYLFPLGSARDTSRAEKAYRMTKIVTVQC